MVSGSSGYKAQGCQSEGQDPGIWQEVPGAASLFQHPAQGWTQNPEGMRAGSTDVTKLVDPKLTPLMTQKSFLPILGRISRDVIA